MKVIIWTIAVIFNFATMVLAVVPQTISYQGYLKDGTGKPVMTATSIVFSLYSSNPARNNPFWRESRSVTPVNGVYSVQLGSVIPLTASFDVPYYLGMKVGADSEMMPLQPLSSAPYARRATVADSLSAGATIPNSPPWVPASGATLQATANNSYLLTGSTLTTITLPTTAAVGDAIKINAQGAGGYTIKPSPGQRISGSGVPADYSIWIPRDSPRIWTSVASSVDGTKLVAVEYGGYIYTSVDSGVTWISRDNPGFWHGVASSKDGAKLVAVGDGGIIYVSIDSGSNWFEHSLASGEDLKSVASSEDGTMLVAAANYGHLYTSTTGGESWVERFLPGFWAGVASSRDGAKLVAVVNGGQIYTSTNSGSNWAAQGTDQNWQAVASSLDGSRLVAVVFDGLIYTSDNSGTTWTSHGDVQSWQSVASSADGMILTAAAWNGPISISLDGGSSWTPRDSSRQWASIASSWDGSKLVAAAEDGQIYTAQATGYSGTAFQSTDLIYTGNGTWMVNGQGSLGQNNAAPGPLATIGGGYANSAGGPQSSIGGGSGNLIGASGYASAIGGGANNSTGNTFTTVGGGSSNLASGYASTVGGGFGNTANGYASTIGGGSGNTASGYYSTVSGGVSNFAGGGYSFAAGYKAKVRNPDTTGTPMGDQGTFVWADASPNEFISTGSNQFIIRSSGGVGINTNAPHEALSIGGNGSALELGAGVPGKDFHSGKIAYQKFSPYDSLDIVGAGSLVTNRKIHFHSQGGATFDGSVYAWNFPGSSSRSLKTNIETIQGALDKVSRLRGVSYDWMKSGRRDIGVIAEEVALVVPEVVFYEDNGSGPKGVDYGHLVGLLIEAVKAMIAENAMQQEDNISIKSAYQALKSDNEALKSRLERIEKILGTKEP